MSGDVVVMPRTTLWHELKTESILYYTILILLILLILEYLTGTFQLDTEGMDLYR